MAIQAEKVKDHADWNPDLQSEEQRLMKRLGKLNLEMKVMVGDGNCQVSLLSRTLLPLKWSANLMHKCHRDLNFRNLKSHIKDIPASKLNNSQKRSASIARPVCSLANFGA